ncbi:Eukaryotic elongation factor 2 kinase [Trichinella nativa]|uniref:Eukaryotic elongation factor 2 kinase n=1 Tax=Trichinella nativa TaxID=6335 RepID=A0A0V1KSF4_9BILA|nr:Eukaryotic elongation factor 2 kinase [Trichinella nativa]
MDKKNAVSINTAIDDEMLIYPFHESPPPAKCGEEFAVGQELVARNASEGDLSKNKIRMKWRQMVKKVLRVPDPWEMLKLNSSPVEQCLRYRYSALRGEWVTDKVYVKIEDEPFDRGAMRICYRLKKCPGVHGDVPSDWSKATNFVAKRYIAQSVSRETYFEDVRLQMDAKLWSDEFNRHNPPKKIDIFQVSIVEFVNRQEKPLFHLEHFIEGNYVKYNSNSGFVLSSSVYRQTPQAFSHFTFEMSAHQLIVVDIQGVGDLYTDPQIHTSDGVGYGDGNLGTKGMALFFYSHACNSICRSLNLAEFDLAPAERASRKKSYAVKQHLSETVVRDAIQCCRDFCPSSGIRAMDYVRARSATSMMAANSGDFTPLSPGHYPDVFNFAESSDETSSSEVNGSSSSSALPMEAAATATGRRRIDSEVDSSSKQDSMRNQYWAGRRGKSLPACIITQQLHLHNSEDNILGRIHLDLARYHELGRFVQPDTQYDRSAAWFHLEKAAECGVHEAVMTMAKIYLGVEHELLQDFMEDGTTDENINQGLKLAEKLAVNGDRWATMILAERYASGQLLGSERKQSYKTALFFYNKLLEQVDPKGNVDIAIYEIHAMIADLYRTGGTDLKKDINLAVYHYNEAAALATENLKGKLAMKYYTAAEQCAAEEEGV